MDQSQNGGNPGPGGPQLFASMFLQETPVVKIPKGLYDPEQQLHVDAETGVTLWAADKTDCIRACGTRTYSTEWCAATDAQGNCTNWITKMDWENIEDWQKDYL